MSLLSQRNSNNSDVLFTARVDNVKNISQILKAINFKDQAIFYCTENGLKVTVEDTKCVQASAFIQSDIFQEYTLNKKDENDLITFKISLSVVLECLNIFGSGSGSGGITTLRMTYQGYGFPLEMLVEEDGVITNCTIKTLTAEEVLDFNFDHSNVLNKVILRSDSLKEVMSDLDMSSDIVEILLSPDSPYFRFTTIGDGGESQADIPKDCEIIESFLCHYTVRSSYKLSHIKPSMKPLAVSSKVSVRIDERGLLCFQYMIKTEDNNTCFVEYYCTPVVQVDDDVDM